MGKLAATISVTAIAALALTASTSPAGAAVTIGQTANPGNPCGVFDRLQQTVTSGTAYVVPPTVANGIITSWSTQAGADAGPLGMKAYRNIGGNTYQVVGHDGPQPLTLNELNTFPTSVAVKAGDVLGNFTPTPGTGPTCTFNVPGEFFIRRAGNLADGSQGTFELQANNSRLNVSAVVEPDCDNDGLGDETQDTDLSTCAATGPATGPGGTPVFCKGKPATIIGTAGNDVRVGSRGRDVIVGLGGNDRLSGGAGNDLICGGAGKDNLNGGKGKDTLLGQKGNDTLKGGAGKDKLFGQKGKDKLIAGGGKDNLKGGGGRDVCIGGKGNDKASKCEVEKSI